VIRLLLVGYGRMGKLVEGLAGEYGCEVAGIVDPMLGPDGVDSDRWQGAGGGAVGAAALGAAPGVAPGAAIDVAIDFSSSDAVVTNLPALARRHINVVVGTTGWGPHEQALRGVVEQAGIGVVAAPNFSTGVVLFDAIVARAATLFASQADVGAFLHEAHHQLKKDAPSGTALLLERTMKQAGFTRPIDVSSTRAGHIPGTHTIGFDGPAETITLTHTARDRSAFARGALVAAAWVAGRQGWFTMQDVLGLQKS
jgi:4-hydroxy-tetrahydrodipicolinate reductase